MNADIKINGAHLVGSAPVESAEHMFRLAAKHLGPYLKRIGDGEIGERDTWCLFQNYRLGASPQLEAVPVNLFKHTLMKIMFRLFVGPRQLPSTWRLKQGVSDPGQIELPDLGYAEAAIVSYETFKNLKTQGVLSSNIRFMVGLPTPLGIVTSFVDHDSRAIVLEAYQAKMMQELQRILDAIPHQELSIQWESVFELMVLEGHKKWHYHGDHPEQAFREHFAMLVNAIPADVEVGVHLCYGDAGHKHFLEPPDTRVMTKVANELFADSRRTVNFLHLPVPRDRDDAAYFEPLKNLQLPAETDLYLGCIHTTGGMEGNKRRIDTAKQVINQFGIATECGFGRRKAHTIPGLLTYHAETIEAYQ